jgi:predicted nucleic-acid-binding protein
MIGLDTNVLIRYLTQDDPAQSLRASRFIESSPPGELFISFIVACELVWVLDSAYGHKRAQIRDALEKLFGTSHFSFEDKALLWLALDDYRKGKGDFADYLLGRVGQKHGCLHTTTLDNGLKSAECFKLL